jgi:AraC-like DNA-binding protein
MSKRGGTSHRREQRLISRLQNLIGSVDICALSLPNLCSELGVSRRSLERAFRHQLHVSPCRYLRTFRLYAAWRDLVRGSGTVTTIATSHGFFELGRFSQQYKSLFGEQPSQTLVRARSDKRCPSLLIVEDEALVALQTAHALSEADFEIVGPADTVSKALDLIKTSGCDAALLDVKLGDETAEQVALELKNRGKPFIVFSAYGHEQLPPLLQSAPFLAKPLRTQSLLLAVRDCLQAA